MTTLPLRTPGDYFKLNDLQNTHDKDFSLMLVIYQDILRTRGDKAFYITVENFNTDLFFGESRTKVLDRAFEILVWNPNMDEDNVSPSFVKSGFSFLNEGELTYYCPISYFYENITDTRTFTNADTDSFIRDNVLYIYENVTETTLYSYIAAGDSITLAGCLTAANNAVYVVDSVVYNQIEVNTGTGDDETERTFIWRSEITLTPNTETIDDEEVEIEIIDELFPVNATVYIQKIVTVQPKMGDLLWIPKLEQLYQIEYVNDTPPHLMFNRNLSYVFKVQLYDYVSNIKVNDQVIEKAPELADLQDLNELILDVTNDVLETEAASVINTSEGQGRETNFKPTNKFER
jgi:hypothetical protein